MPPLHTGCNHLMYLIYLGLPCNKKLYSVLDHDLPIDSPLFVTKFDLVKEYEFRDIHNDPVNAAYVRHNRQLQLELVYRKVDLSCLVKKVNAMIRCETTTKAFDKIIDDILARQLLLDPYKRHKKEAEAMP